MTNNSFESRDKESVTKLLGMTEVELSAAITSLCEDLREWGYPDQDRLVLAGRNARRRVDILTAIVLREAKLTEDPFVEACLLWFLIGLWEGKTRYTPAEAGFLLSYRISGTDYGRVEALFYLVYGYYKSLERSQVSETIHVLKDLHAASKLGRSHTLRIDELAREL